MGNMARSWMVDDGLLFLLFPLAAPVVPVSRSVHEEVSVERQVGASASYLSASPKKEGIPVTEHTSKESNNSGNRRQLLEIWEIMTTR
jgi:hypothetical protein